MGPMMTVGVDTAEYLPALPYSLSPMPLNQAANPSTPGGAISISTSAAEQLVMALIYKMTADPANSQGYQHNPKHYQQDTEQRERNSEKKRQQ